MATTPQAEADENHGWKGTLFGFVFAALVLGGAAWATVESTSHGHDDSPAESADHSGDETDEESE